MQPNQALQSNQVIENDDLFLEQFFCGPMGNCLYLIGDPSTKQAYIIDPAFEPVELYQQALRRGFEIEAVVCTHAHQDHVGGELFGMQIPGLRELRGTVELPIYIHATEEEYLVEKTGQPRETLRQLEDGQVLELGNLKIEVLHLPGHSPGCCAFHVGNHLITGDTLFVQGVGRIDLPGSDSTAMFESLQRLKTLPPETHIYPGHNYGPASSSTLGKEIQHNPYLQPAVLDQWRVMMGQL